MSDSLSLNLAGSSALDEETARAELYGLLAQLYYARPTPDTLAALRVAVTEAPAAGGFLQEPWQQLVGAARARTTRPLPQNLTACSVAWASQKCFCMARIT